LAYPISGFPLHPLGSKRVWLNLSHSTLRDTPYCKASDTAVAKQSMRPETVEPSFAVVMKISPTVPSS
jgi:hypothetical protein